MEKMKFALRWYGDKYDTVPLKYIKQIPNVNGVISTLFNKQSSEIWTYEEILDLKNNIENHNLKLYGIESLNVSEDIKAATDLRDIHIDNYIQSLENLGKAGIKLVCYNFMPIFDWTRTDLNRKIDDDSYVLAYDQEVIDKADYINMFDKMSLESSGTILPGWDKDKLNKLENLFELYKNISEEDLFNNLKYFLEKIMPVCDKYDINMAIHPDDPAWPVMDIPRIVINKSNIQRILQSVDNKHNGITLCTGSLASNSNNDILDMIDSFKDRIHFVHIRNIKHLNERYFEEIAHNSDYGELDIYRIFKKLDEIDYSGIIRPDHGRMIWDEKAMPGYGLYDRALAVSYFNGLLEAIEKENNED